MPAQFLSHYLTILDIKIIFSSVSNLKKILNLTSDPIIIQTLLCIFLTFVIKHLINSIHKTFKKHSIINGFCTHHFYPTALKGCRGIVFTHGVRMGGWREKVCPGCISETIRCRKLIRGRDID